MRCFLYEYVTASTDAGDLSSASVSLRAEGVAMLAAVRDDFLALPDMEVRTLDFVMGQDERTAFDALSKWADATLVIAPEFDGILQERAQWVLDASGRLLGPSPTDIALTSDKLQLATHWHRHEVPTPRTLPVQRSPELPFPQVWKHRFGAGSIDITRVNTPLPVAADDPRIAQPLCPGNAVSASMLIDAYGVIHPLCPAQQHLSDEGLFHYHGGDMPLSSVDARRAIALATRAVAAVPTLRGYVGVDLVLGDGIEWAIEINPRLTTSYIGLRQLARFSLAEAMLACFDCDTMPIIAWHPGPVSWQV